MKPGCPHFIQPNLIENRKSECKCGNIFVIDKTSKDLTEPICPTCREERAKKLHPPRPGERKYVDRSKIADDIFKKFGLDKILSENNSTRDEDQVEED